MTLLEEQQSLQQFPIPTDAMIYSACAKDLVLPFIAQIQEKIADATAQLEYLHKQLDILKSRAISENIKDSGDYYLVEIPRKRMRNPITDIDTFRIKFPQGYDAVRAEQAYQLDRKYQKEINGLDTSQIPLTIADNKIGKDLVSEFVGFQLQKVEIEVRVRERLK